MTTLMRGAEPFFGWLDYDERDAQRMREVFSAFDDKETIDSLGLGVIRDSIADQLFPGISTIQTRARYFLFVPWICRMLETEGVAPAQFSARLRELEVALIESLRQVEGSSAGVIGYSAGSRLIRLPSTVYWNGLRVFGLRLLSLSTSQYRGIAARLGALLADTEKDDDGEPAAVTRRMWDPAMPAPPDGFPFGAVSLKLSSEESDYLTGKIISHCPETMIGELARDLAVDRSPPFPWEVALPHPPSRLTGVLDHARNFSELMQGAQALYNLLLARRAEQQLARDTADLQETLIDDLAEWAAVVEERRAVLSRWISGDDFWTTIERISQVSFPTRGFVQAWATFVLDRPGEIASNAKAAALISEREFRLKGKLARLTEARALESWNGEPFSRRQMMFRWSNAQLILNDLQYYEEA